MNVRLSKMSISETIRAWIFAPVLEKLKIMEAQMSTLSEGIAAVAAGLSTLETTLTETGAALTAEIQQISDRIAAGSVTQADLDALTAIGTRITAAGQSLGTLKTNIENIIPDAPPPPPAA